LQVKIGRDMFPTGLEVVYPFQGLFGWVQMLLVVGTGTQEVDVVVLVVFVDVAEQVYTEVVTVGGGGGVHPAGGHLDLHLEAEHEPPGQ